jgi:chitodextrinase
MAFALAGAAASAGRADSGPKQPASQTTVTLTRSAQADADFKCGKTYRIALVATAACPDRTPPTRPRSLAATGQTQTSIALTWASSTDNVGVVGYELRRSGDGQDDDPVVVPGPPFTFAGLECGRAYRLFVLARDAAGNRSSPGVLLASTAACAPAAPARIVTLSNGQTTIDLAWLPSRGATAYLLAINGGAPITVKTLSYRATGLTCGTTYTFTVSATNEAGTSSVPASAQAATAACIAPPGPTGANLWIDEDGGTCTRSPVAVGYVDGAACGTFQAAIHAALAGDLVLVRCRTATSCTFPTEELTGDRAGTGDVTVAAATGFAVSFDEPAGSGRQVFINGLHHVTLRDIGFGHANSGGSTPNLRIDCARDVTLVNSSGRRFAMFEGNTNVTFRGGDWGGYGSPDEEDSTMGTTGGSGPLITCPGDAAPQPQHNILFDGVTWHDVFWNVACTTLNTCAAWGSSHPDCFEINGYVDGVTVQNSTFYHCGNTMLSLFTDQGNVDNVVVRNNTFRDMAPTSNWGIQWTDTSAFTCSGNKFLNNSYMPNAPTAWIPNTPPRFECNLAPGGVPTEVAGNTFQQSPPAADCTRSKTQDAVNYLPYIHVYNTNWHDNTFLAGAPCVG